MEFLIRIASLVRKELLAVLRDKKSRLALIIPPIIQIAIFGYAATMNVTRVPYAVLDKDGGEAARPNTSRTWKARESSGARPPRPRKKTLTA